MDEMEIKHAPVAIMCMSKLLFLSLRRANATATPASCEYSPVPVVRTAHRIRKRNVCTCVKMKVKCVRIYSAGIVRPAPTEVLTSQRILSCFDLGISMKISIQKSPKKIASSSELRDHPLQTNKQTAATDKLRQHAALKCAGSPGALPLNSYVHWL